MITLKELKDYREARDARLSEVGATKAQQDLLDRMGVLDLLSCTIDLIEQSERDLTESENALAAHHQEIARLRRQLTVGYDT